MGNYQAYEKYKDSGVEWLGEIPEHWEALKIKRLTAIKRGASPRPIDDPKYFDDDGEYAWVRIADVTASERYLENTTQRLSELGKSFSVSLEPDELFLSIAGSVGKPMITKIKCCIHDGFVYFPDLKISKELIYYIFHSGQPYLGLGKMGTQLNLNTETVGAITIGLPPLNEQESIANFLDRKTKQIDGLIAKKETLLAKLDEKRSAIISHAVTKGLNPTVPMRDSGIEWLGDIPKHWEIKRLKFIVLNIEGGFSPQCYSFPPDEGEWGVLKTGCVNGGIFNPLESKTLPQDIEPLPYLEIQKGDVLMSRASGSRELIASVALVSQKTKARLLLSDKIFRLSLNNSLCDKEFFIYSMGAREVRQQIYQVISGAEGLANNIAQSAIREILIPLPPLIDQDNICGYLGRKLSEAKSQMKKVQEAIERLKEYRTALITNAVTGKIDVRQVSLN